MKQRWIIAIVFLAVLGTVAAVAFLWPNTALRDLEQTRRDLRKAGFKLDLSEFDFSASTEERSRTAALTNGNLMSRTVRDDTDARRNMFMQERIELMRSAGFGAAIVLWQQPTLPDRSAQNPWSEYAQATKDLWPVFRDALDAGREELDEACAAALSGRIRFDLAANRGMSMLLPHLAHLRGLSQTLSSRALLELHDGHRDAAWTNVLAVTRLATAYEAETTEISQLMRCGLVTLAFDTTWQALLAGGWREAQLAALQREWQSLEVFKPLPETEAFARASHVDVCQRERKERAMSSTVFHEMLRSPRSAVDTLTSYWNSLDYRRRGTYDEERELLVYHRDREVQLRAVIQAPTWLQMRESPMATNAAPFQSRRPSRVGTLINLRQSGMGFMRRGRGLLGQAAEAEARRRVLMTAIALERYRLRHGAYPENLAALVPEWLPQPLTDFIDGQPLRYRLTDDGHFVLYSVGLDGTDNGGDLRQPRRRNPYGPRRPEFGGRESGDLVWPRPASAAEVKARQTEEEQEVESDLAAVRRNYAEVQKAAEADREATVTRLLEQGTARRTNSHATPTDEANEPYLLGRPFRQLLRNPDATGTNTLTLDELLTPRFIGSTQDLGTAFFELPVRYETVTNIGFLHLIIDGGLDTVSREEEGDRQTCERATNGNCLLGWTSTYDPPGKHAVQAEFIAAKNEERFEHAPKARGPAVALVTTNLCQFDSAYDHFDERGGTLYARLVESNAVYGIELTVPGGGRLRSFSGTSSNGEIRVHWDLKDEHGNRCTNEVVDSLFKITLPGSGRSQTLKGP